MIPTVSVPPGVTKQRADAGDRPQIGESSPASLPALDGVLTGALTARMSRYRPIRHALLALLVVVLSLGTWAGPAHAAPRYDWPLSGDPPVTRPFDPPDKPWLSGHRGVDLASAPGVTVLAAGDGTVAFAGEVAGKPVISIDHPDGIRTTYEPVVATLSAGDPVQRGQPIGTLQAGHPECAVEACLHWGARRGERYIDPLSLLRPRRVRLLPL